VTLFGGGGRGIEEKKFAFDKIKFVPIFSGSLAVLKKARPAGRNFGARR